MSTESLEDQSHNVSLAPSWCVPIVKDFFSLQRNQNDKKAAWCCFVRDPVERAEAALVVIRGVTNL